MPFFYIDFLISNAMNILWRSSIIPLVVSLMYAVFIDFLISNDIKNIVDEQYIRFVVNVFYGGASEP
jgi:hypothetical protein